MAGVLQNRSTIVKFIQSLFTSDTDELLVVKELLQNADDSEGATFAAIGVSEGLPQSSHPLLRGPALFAVNDGKFTPKDAGAIITMGLSTKGGDANTVGKFGLGLKSAFSLAEAIFFLDGRLDPAQTVWDPGHYDIFSPWLGGTKSLAPAWEPFTTQQRGEILDHLRQLGLPDGFAVWIPLRRAEHGQIPGEAAIRAIMRRFPGDAPFTLPDAVVSIAAELLPLMGRVRRIQFKCHPDLQAPWTALSLDGTSRSLDLTGSAPFDRPLAGSVNAGGKEIARYVGREVKLSSTAVAALASSEFWPSADTVDDYGEPVTKSDPAVPHGAALWQRTPAQGQATFQGHWSVFLPVEPLTPQISIQGNQHFTLTLHGYFFLDTKRKHIYQWRAEGSTLPDNEEELRAAWNARLARETSLPWVLEGLMAITTGQPDQVIASLTSALHQWVNKAGLQQEITSQSQWARILVKDKFRWCLLPASQKTLPIPGDVEIQQVIPQPVPGFALRDLRSPKLLHGVEARQWPVHEAQALLAQWDFTVILTHSPALQALTELAEYLPLKSLQEHLIPKLRQALQTIPSSQLSRYKAKIAALLGSLLPGGSLQLPAEGLSQELNQRLMQLPLQVLLLPSGYSTVTNTRVLSRQDAQRLLGAIQEPEDLAPVLRLVKDTLDHEEDFADLISGRRLLPTLLGTKGTGPWLSAGKVQELASQGVAFRQQGEDVALLSALQDVLGERRLYLVPGRLVDLLGIEGIPTLSLSSALNSVWQAGVLGPLEARLNFLRKLSERWRSFADLTEHRNMVRYLLHADPTHRQDTLTTLLVGSDRKGVWWKAAQLAREHLPQGWRVVAEPVDFLNDRDLKRLGLERIGPDSLTTILSSAPHLFRGSELQPAERRTLILDLQDDAVLKQLPIFTTTDDRVVAAGAGTHLEGGFDPGEFLRGQLTFLARPEDRDYATRLRSLAPPLSAAGAWDALRNQPELWQHWESILRMMKEAGAIKLRQADELHWWPRAEHGGARPRDVLFFPQAADSNEAIQRLQKAGSQEVTVALDLHPDFLAAFPTSIMHLLASESSREKALLDLLSTARTYFVGRSGTVPVPVWLRAFAGASADLLPLYGLIQAFEQHRELQGKLLGAAARPVQPGQVLALLEYLHTQATTGDTETRQAALQIYPLLLDDLRTGRVSEQTLAPLFLLNEEGEWCPAAQLTRAGTQFEGRYVLAREHAAALYGPDATTPAELLVHQTPADPALQPVGLEESRNHLLQFVGGWAPVVPQEQRGAFLALIDGNPALHQAAQPYLMNYPVQVLREEAFKGVTADKLPRGFETYQALIDRVRLKITPSHGATATVTNLLGDALTVPYKADEQLTTLFSPTHGERPFNAGEYFVYPLTLKNVRPHDPGIDYPELLWQSLQWVLHHYHAYQPPHLHAAFHRATDSSQTTVTATQRRLIQAAAQIWGRQLGVNKNSRVSQQLKAIDLEDRKAVSAREREAIDTATAAEDRVRTLQNELKVMVETDPETQQALLISVRQKIEDMQYVPRSVPFELLQNADDALTEWAELGSPLSEARTTVTVNLTESALLFTHYGRPINYYGDASGQARGFDGDLEKMLALLSSDKDERATGKFGLGFKSTFLLSDRPAVLSGRLAFEVVGGVYPLLPQQERLDHFRAYQQRVDPPDVQDGTLVALPLRDLAVGAEVLSHFEQLAPYLLAFTRSIRRIQIRHGDMARTLTWQEKPESASVSLAGATVGKSPFHALVLKGEGFKLILPYKDTGFTSLPHHVPNLWVTAPTAERLGLPFLLNADFPLDPGRAQLARNEALFEPLFDQLRPKVTAAFADLLSRSQSEPFLQQLGWHAPRPDTLLVGLWKQLAEPLARDSDSPAFPLLRKLFWGSGGAIGQLAFEHPLIPTGLPGEYAGFILAGTPKLRVLGFDQTTFKGLAAQKEFQKLYAPGTLISRETALTLEKLSLPVPEQKLELRAALETLLKDQRITPERSEWLAAVLSEDTVEALLEDEKGEEWLGTLKFLAQDGQYRLAGALLMPTKDSEEQARAGFAPTAAVLSTNYSPSGLTLARRIRSDVPKGHIAAWILGAQGEARQAALQYLLKHLKPSDVEAKELQKQLRGRWLQYDQLIHLPEWTAFTPEQRTDLLNLLRQLPAVNAQTSPPLLIDPQSAEDEAVDDEDLLDPGLPSDSLNRIQRWWQQDHAQHIERFNAWTYPGASPFVHSREYDPADPAHRQAWLSLLLLGSLQSMGRTRPEQHRGFLQYGQEQGWLAAFSDRKAPDEAWMNAVRAYLAQQPDLLKYYAWMRGFVGFYQIGRWLDEYVALFTQLDRLPETSLRSLLAPNSNPALQGSGLSAPPLTQTLGIGAPFVLRELLRAGVLKPEKLRPLAYMPTRRLKNLIGDLTGESIATSDPEDGSRRIAAALAKRLGERDATFLGDYDLPFQILLGSGSDDDKAYALQLQVLGRPLYRRFP